MIYSNGDSYKGIWKKDKKNGNGVEEKIDGSKYEGLFKNDKKNGYAVKSLKTGEILEVFF